MDPCDNSLRRTKLWVTQHCPPEQIDATLQEIQEMGGYCDCEVLLNCYEDYEIE